MRREDKAAAAKVLEEPAMEPSVCERERPSLVATAPQGSRARPPKVGSRTQINAVGAVECVDEDAGAKQIVRWMAVRVAMIESGNGGGHCGRWWRRRWDGRRHGWW